jgi:hypothetical protein
VKAEHLELSKLKKGELYDFMKETRDKEEYRRASAIKQKLEGGHMHQFSNFPSAAFLYWRF